MSDPTRALHTGLALWLGLMLAASPSLAAARVKAAKKAPAPSVTVTQLAQWVVATDDHSDLPFVIIDKVAARVFVFGADGSLRGDGPALLGSARGDNSTPGVGDREMSDIPLDERTTPAGRFVASFGTASGKRRVLWVDYPTAISMHPVVTSNPAERRPQRLASPTPKDNRITHGCINVSANFYEKVVRPTFTGTSGIVYILPEKKPVLEVFPAFRVVPSADPAPHATPAAG
ncbi:MAG TPA: L,D-transpeptidase [Phenylobacterium sp.]|jgi:hypothetical protein